MKRSTLLFLFAMSFMIAFADQKLSSFKGVWANDNGEAVITDEVCIFYEKRDDTMRAFLEIPSCNIFHTTTFNNVGEVKSSVFQNPLELKLDDGHLIISGQKMKKIEELEIVSPYKMTKCDQASDVGKCLQEWRLGVRFDMQNDMPYCEINTNRHMFVYLVNNSMVYIRAAATRNNDQGTLFFQNIRMMKNNNTGEYTMIIIPDNLNFAESNLEIDNSKFNPTACTFSPDGGIYWSLISFTPDLILLNGCGETYQVPRPTKETPIKEWIKFHPYNDGHDLRLQQIMNPAARSIINKRK